MENDKHRLPFPRSYWVSHPHLLAGFYPGDADAGRARAKLTGLLKAGVRLIVNLMEEVEIGHDGRPLEPYEEPLAEVATELGVQAHMDRFSIPDVDVPTPEHMMATLNAIDRAISAGNPVYLHCWLARHGIATGDAALERIAALRAGGAIFL